MHRNSQFPHLFNVSFDFSFPYDEINPKKGFYFGQNSSFYSEKRKLWKSLTSFLFHLDWTLRQMHHSEQISKTCFWSNSHFQCELWLLYPFYSLIMKLFWFCLPLAQLYKLRNAYLKHRQHIFTKNCRFKLIKFLYECIFNVQVWRNIAD